MTISTNADIQTALNTLGASPQLAVDGKIGPLTTAAVISFQKNNPPLVVDGVPGPATKTALEAALLSAGQGSAAAPDNMTNLLVDTPPLAPTLMQILGGSPAPAPARTVAVHLPATPAAPASTVHVNTATGAVAAAALGAKAPSAWNPMTWTGTEKAVGGVAAVLGLVGLKKFLKLRPTARP
jgi:peptidoglycan hydrolase-like protein with peptidoglycan-binding domain